MALKEIMDGYIIKDVSASTDRFKLYVLESGETQFEKCIDGLREQAVPVINLGKVMAAFLDTLQDHSYLSIDAYDYAKKVLDERKTKVAGKGNDIIAIYNIGILLEPALELNAVQLLKEFSKSAALIIIWENQIVMPDRLCWPTQANQFFLDFSETKLKRLQNAI